MHFDHRELSCNSDASHQGVHKRRQPDHQGMLRPDAQLSIVKAARTFVLEKEAGCRRTRPTAFRFKFKLQELEGNQLLNLSDDRGTGGLGEAPESVDAENLFLYYYMDMDEPDREKIGHQLTDLIKACSFRGKDCTSSE